MRGTDSTICRSWASCVTRWPPTCSGGHRGRGGARAPAVPRVGAGWRAARRARARRRGGARRGRRGAGCSASSRGVVLARAGGPRHPVVRGAHRARPSGRVRRDRTRTQAGGGARPGLRTDCRPRRNDRAGFAPGLDVVGRGGAATATVTPGSDRQGRAALGWPIGGGVFVNDLRRARTEFGRSYWLIPEARATPFAPIPSRCYAEFRATLKRDLRHASRAERDVALRAQQEQLGVQRLQSEHRQGLCFAAIALDTRPRPGAAGYGCSAAPTAARPLGVGAIDPVGGGATIQAGVVADGYVSVSAHFPGGRAPRLSPSAPTWSTTSTSSGSRTARTGPTSLCGGGCAGPTAPS